ncbi:MAG: cobalamin-binding protein [Burkholderiales bacterium]|nr:cobalamin-binding protein [Burkholderiales bacterium]
MLLAPAAAGAEVAVHDDYGRRLHLARPAQRIVSLAPHLTELLFAAGAGAHVVGASEHSDHPPEAARLPRVASATRVDLEAVLALEPDLVVAWPQAATRRAIDRLESLGLPTYRSEPRTLEQVPETIERFGILSGQPARARQAAQAFRARAAALTARYAARDAVQVFYQVWSRPIITVNGEHLISRVINLCGGRNVFAELPLLAPEIDREAVLAADPEVVIASGVGDLRPAWLDDWNAFQQLRAVQRGQLYAMPADLLQRHTPRILDGAERLCGILEKARVNRQVR